MRFAVLLFVYFLGLGSYLASLSPYIVAAYAEDAYRYFLASQFAYPLGYFLAGYLSDRTRLLRAFFITSAALLAPAQFLLFSSADQPLLTLVLSGLTRMLLAANLQLMSIAVLEAIGESRYARMRSAGTIGFACFQLTLWLLPELLAPSPSAMHPGTAARMAIDAATSGQAGALAFLMCVPLGFVMQTHRKSHTEYRFRDALRFSVQPRHLAFLGLSFLFYFNFQIVDNYLGRFWELHTGGMSMVFGGWFLAVLLEIPFLFIAARMARQAGIRSLIWLAAGAGALRFGWLALDILGSSPVPAIFSQILHGLHFTGYHIGVIYWLRSSCPDHLYGSVYGVYNIVAHSLGGMAGNILFGALLFAAGTATWLESVISAAGLASGSAVSGAAGTVGFLPVFALAALLNVLVMIGFAFLRAPAPRIES